MYFYLRRSTGDLRDLVDFNELALQDNDEYDIHRSASMGLDLHREFAQTTLKRGPSKNRTQKGEINRSHEV